jgi:hypothetical protein
MATFGFSKLLSLGLLSTAMIGVGSCNSDYALYKIHPTFSDAVRPNDRIPVEQCRLVITDDKGVVVLNSIAILASHKINDTTSVGCAGGGATPKDLGVLSYSSSLTTGQLTFKVEALDNNNTVLFSGETTQSAKVFSNPKTDEVSVDILIAKP